jgi:hypothetical protein
MEPARQKALFSEFLTRAVAEYSFSGGLLQIRYPFRHLEHFEKLLGVAAQNKSFHSLTQQQFDLSLEEIIRDNTLRSEVMLVQSFVISQWSINCHPIGTNSIVSLFYGAMPRISTHLLLETVEHFQHIKHVLADLEFCTLNEKHLKPIRRSAKGKNPNDDAV